MRAQSRSPLQKVVDEAVRQTREALRREGFVAPIEPMAPPQNSTEAGETEDGVIYTIHTFMLGVDALNDPSSQLSVRGTPPNYRR